MREIEFLVADTLNCRDRDILKLREISFEIAGPFLIGSIS